MKSEKACTFCIRIFLFQISKMKIVVDFSGVVDFRGIVDFNGTTMTIMINVDLF